MHEHSDEKTSGDRSNGQTQQAAAAKMNRHTEDTPSGGRLKRTDIPMTLRTVVAKSRIVPTHRREWTQRTVKTEHGSTDALVTNRTEVIQKGQKNADGHTRRSLGKDRTYG